jgi:hypothetical protein
VQRRMARRVWILLPILLGAWGRAAHAEDLRVAYSGELIDEGAHPLAGVFALNFKLYANHDDTDPIWTERHYVAVVDGEYSVKLGTQTPLDPSLAERNLFVAVEFLDQEILRVPLTMQPIQTPQEQIQSLAGAGTDGVAQVTFAQLADRALMAEEAGHARDCDTLGGHTPEELDRYDEVMQALANHEADPNAHSQGQSGLGSSSTVLQRIGGDGGNPYTRMCPTGYVAVGIRGGAGTMVDSVELVCAPLR